MTGACFRSRNEACSRSGCCMFRLPSVHCGFPVHVPDTGMRHPSQYVRQALAEMDDSVAALTRHAKRCCRCRSTSPIGITNGSPRGRVACSFLAWSADRNEGGSPMKITRTDVLVAILASVRRVRRSKGSCSRLKRASGGSRRWSQPQSRSYRPLEFSRRHTGWPAASHAESHH
jgi:hypothetical protein